LLLTKPGVIQRTAKFQAGAKNRVWNLASRFADGQFTIGFTPPVLNGSEMDSADAAKAAIVAPTVETNAVAAGFEASVTVDPVNTGSFLMTLPTAGPWSTVTAKTKIENEIGINECSGAGDTTFSVDGDPDDATMLANLQTHEDHHASDHEAVFNDVLVPWAEKITMAKDNATKFAGNDGSAAEAALYAAVGGTPDEIATKLWDDWIAANDAFHAGAGSVQGYGTGQGANADCSTSFVKLAWLGGRASPGSLATRSRRGCRAAGSPEHFPIILGAGVHDVALDLHAAAVHAEAALGTRPRNRLDPSDRAPMAGDEDRLAAPLSLPQDGGALRLELRDDHGFHVRHFDMVG
jgi:hypothetical protein